MLLATLLLAASSELPFAAPRRRLFGLTRRRLTSPGRLLSPLCRLLLRRLSSLLGLPPLCRLLVTGSRALLSLLALVAPMRLLAALPVLRALIGLLTALLLVAAAALLLVASVPSVRVLGLAAPILVAALSVTTSVLVALSVITFVRLLVPPSAADGRSAAGVALILSVITRRYVSTFRSLVVSVSWHGRCSRGVVIVLPGDD